jgi:hypothetical protein
MRSTMRHACGVWRWRAALAVAGSERPGGTPHSSCARDCARTDVHLADHRARAGEHKSAAAFPLRQSAHSERFRVCVHLYDLLLGPVPGNRMERCPVLASDDDMVPNMADGAHGSVRGWLIIIIIIWPCGSLAPVPNRVSKHDLHEKS